MDLSIVPDPCNSIPAVRSAVVRESFSTMDWQSESDGKINAIRIKILAENLLPFAKT